jgi:multidrug efflux system membrane fusion protein
LIVANAMLKRDYDEKQNAAREASANQEAAQAALETAKINRGHAGGVDGQSDSRARRGGG